LGEEYFQDGVYDFADVFDAAHGCTQNAVETRQTSATRCEPDDLCILVIFASQQAGDILIVGDGVFFDELNLIHFVSREVTRLLLRFAK